MELISSRTILHLLAYSTLYDGEETNVLECRRAVFEAGGDPTIPSMFDYGYSFTPFELVFGHIYHSGRSWIVSSNTLYLSINNPFYGCLFGLNLDLGFNHLPLTGMVSVSA